MMPVKYYYYHKVQLSMVPINTEIKPLGQKRLERKQSEVSASGCKHALSFLHLCLSGYVWCMYTQTYASHTFQRQHSLFGPHFK